jgi:hypothetical protein
VYTTNATFYFSTRWERNLKLYEVPNDVIKANETIIRPNDQINPTIATTTYDQLTTSTVVAGKTIQSPDAYYIYSRIRILTAAAVKDSAGEIACVTDSVTGEADATQYSVRILMHKPRFAKSNSELTSTTDHRACQ